MNIILVGKSCSGKTKIKDYLCENFRYDGVTTVTTRGPRDGEVNGVDYHFVSKEKFSDMAKNGELVLMTSLGSNHYGVLERDTDADVDNKVLIVDPAGVKELIDGVNYFNFAVFYIYSSDETRECRSTGNDRKNIDRDIADIVNFANFDIDTYAIRIDNSGSIENSVREILEVVNDFE